MLDELGADLNAAARDPVDPEISLTPAFVASRSGHAEVVRLLVELGADMNAADADEMTPADIAGLNGHLEVLEVLQAAFWNSTQGQVIADASTASSYHSTPSTGSLYDVDDQIASE